MFTKTDIEALSDDQLLAIANVMEPRDDWSVTRKYADQGCYDVVTDKTEEDGYDAIVQVYFGNIDRAIDRAIESSPETLITHFGSGGFQGSLPNPDELEAISKIILG